MLVAFWGRASDTRVPNDASVSLCTKVLRAAESGQWLKNKRRGFTPSSCFLCHLSLGFEPVKESTQTQIQKLTIIVPKNPTVVTCIFFLHKQKIQAHKKIQAIVYFNIFVYLCRRLYSMSYEQGSHYGYSSDCLS